uniref:Uncharacterized protein n=1 Tax=Anguilla anguilla TaxID=7936 RepID=A0A0E9U4M3_ANGAN
MLFFIFYSLLIPHMNLETVNMSIGCGCTRDPRFTN